MNAAFLLLGLCLMRVGSVSTTLMSVHLREVQHDGVMGGTGIDRSRASLVTPGFIFHALDNAMTIRATSVRRACSQHCLRATGTKIRGVHAPLHMAIEVDQVRANTRGCGSVVHFNNAGASLMPKVVADTYVEYVRQEEMSGGYEVAAARHDELEKFYESAAILLNCDKEEVAFVESATRGWALAFYSVAFEEGDRIITSAADYGSNFVAYLQARDAKGAEIVVVPDDGRGQIDMERLRAEVKHPKARMISISHIPTGGGLVNPAEEIGEIAREHKLIYFLDACQSVGQMPVDVQKIGCHVLTATGRKYLRGPRGTGLLFVRRTMLEQLVPCMLDQYGALLVSEQRFKLREDARRFEMWEYNFAGKVGLAAAIDYALSLGIADIWSRIDMLSSCLRQGLKEIDKVTVTDCGRVLCGIVTFTLEGKAAAQVKEELAKQGINVSVSSAASGGSRVWFDRRGLTEVLRASLHYYNTQHEIDHFLHVLRAVASSP